MQAQDLRGTKEFVIKCYEIGDIGSCMLSAFCPCVAIAKARGFVDESHFCVNCYYLNPVLLRWLVRSAYNIPGEWMHDCLLGVFCHCCVINQALQTSRQYGPASVDGGSRFNNYNFSNTSQGPDCGTLCYALCCMPCAVGTLLQQSTGMPFLMGCLCANVCIARNVSRYQYRIKGNDCNEDCCLPNFVVGAGLCALSLWPCWFCCPCCFCIAAAVWPYLAALLVTPLAESKKFNGSHYLSPLPPAALQYFMSVPMSGVVMIQPQYVQQPGQPQLGYPGQLQGGYPGQPVGYAQPIQQPPPGMAPQQQAPAYGYAPNTVVPQFAPVAQPVDVKS